MSALGSLLPTSLGDVSFINSLLVTLGVAISTLSQSLQNGNSLLGLPDTPVLPSFLGGPSTDGYPWGNRTANGTNYYEDVPNTGVTRFYELHLSRALLAPDGVEREMIVINGQYPGPTLEANWGDKFHITVYNDIKDPEEGTTLHWHGLEQRNSQFMDGVPAVMQCPIPPGSSMIYEFQADLYGTGWYHSHYSAQYTAGAYGAMVIYGPSNVPYDIDLGPVLVTDYYHKNATALVEQTMSENVLEAQTVFADNTLIQGKMRADCSKLPKGTACTPDARIAKFVFTPGKTHKLRLINPSSFAVIVVSIDHHTMQVVANDYVPIKPYSATTVTLAAGQRVDIIVRAIPSLRTPNGAYWLRIRQPVLCALAFQPFAVAAIYYNGSDTDGQPVSVAQPDFLSPRLLDCANDDLAQTEPSFSIPAADPDTTIQIDITSAQNVTGNTLYFMNGHSFRGDYNDPPLLMAAQGNLSFADDPQRNVFNFGSNQTIRIMFQNHVPFAHPMHIHGQNMQVLSEGVGAWDGKTLVRSQNPLRRDTQILQPSGYLVVQLTSNNPGIWPFHCHFVWHVSQGLYINVVQKPDEIAKLEIPQVVTDTCRAWNRYAAGTIIDQIDSGVRL